MRSSVVVALSLSAAALAILACSSDDGAAEGAPDGGFGGQGDAMTDAPSSGADGSTSSGGPDAAGPFCATLTPKPSLCEDFDDGTPPTDGDTQIDPGGSVAVDGALARSAPNGLKVVSAPASGAFTNALLRVPVDGPATPTRFKVGFSYRAEVAPPTQGVFVLVRAFLSAEHQITIELASADGAVVREIDVGGVYASTKLGKLPAAKTWIRYELDFDLGATKKLTLAAEGAAPVEVALEGTGYDLFAANFGLTTDLAASYTAYYDDVVLDLK